IAVVGSPRVLPHVGGDPTCPHYAPLLTRCQRARARNRPPNLTVRASAQAMNVSAPAVCAQVQWAESSPDPPTAVSRRSARRAAARERPGQSGRRGGRGRGGQPGWVPVGRGGASVVPDASGDTANTGTGHRTGCAAG